MIKAATPEAYELFHRGLLALSEIEANGFKVDVDYLERAIAKTQKKIKRLEEELKEDEVFKVWRKAFGSKTNFTSYKQLGKVVFDILKHPYKVRRGEENDSGDFRADEKAFEDVDVPFVRRYQEVRRLKKVKGTYLEGILREATHKGFIHCSFGLNIPISYRGNCEDPNLQNIPIRLPEISKLVRKAFIPRNRWRRLVEVDFKILEVRVSACYNKDPKLIRYIKDPTTDMHRDMASRCYMLDAGDVSKDARYCAKNKFVFPEFYGDWYMSCAEALWKAVRQMNLKTESGVPLYDHLRSKGIKKLGACDPEQKPRPGTFEAHIKKQEEWFWGPEQFAVYAAWKKRAFREYQSRGGFASYTGFWYEGLFSRKDVSNYPIQGSAFHCLLWCIIRILEILKQRKMKSKVVLEIHDCVIGDCPEDEAEDFAAICKQVMTEELPRHWKWIIVPMAVEIEMAPVGESWYAKQEVHL